MSSHGLRRSLCVLLFVITVCLVSSPVFGQAKPVAPAAKDANALREFKNIERPLTFEENQGQFDSKARFVSRGPGYELLLSPNQADVSLSKASPSGNTLGHRIARFDHADTLHLTLKGANPKATIAGQGKLATKSNYYIGNDRSKWREGIQNYSRVLYESIYPGIDLVYYGNQRRLEHDFVVAPGADPNRIHIGVSGAKSVRLDSNGDVVMEVDDGSLRLLKPVLYQDINGQHKPITGHYQLAADKSVRFKVGQYDKGHTLVIDPVLSYSTYLGGSGADQGFGVAINGSTVYVAGFTNSSDFVGATGSATCCSFVTAFSLTSSTPVYSTYVSANIIGQQGNPIAVDPSGNAYVTGSTAGGLPTNGSAFPSLTFGGGEFDAFLMKLSNSGTLVMSGYLGGSGYDIGNGIAYDPFSHHVLVTGTTQSANFPANATTNSLEPVDAAQFYSSADAGTTWSSASGSGSSALGGMDAQAILIIPGTVAPTKYYVGGTAGVYTSGDGGATWSGMNFGLAGVSVESLAYDSHNGNIYAGTSGGIYLYANGAGEWMRLGGPQYGVPAIIVVPSTANSAATIYAVDDNLGFFVSTDGGTTWSNNNNGLPNPTSLTSMSLVRDSNGKLIAAVPASGTGQPNVYTSTDAVNWTATTGSSATGFPNAYYSYNHNSLFIDPSTNRLYLGGFYYGGAYTSTDGGNTWTPLTGLPSSFSNQFNTIIADPLTAGTIYAGTNQGLFKSADYGKTWAPLTTGFTSQSVVSLAVDTAATSSSGKTVLFSGGMTGQGFAASFDANSGVPIFEGVFGGDNVSPYFNPSTQGVSIAVDSAENVYVTGGTYSSANTFPSAGSATPKGDGDAFLYAVNASGDSLWSTFVGGTYYDVGQSVAVGADGNIVVYGQTDSPDLPTTSGVYQPTCNVSGSCPQGLFLSKFSSAGTNIFTTYFAPPNAFFFPYGMALDSQSNIYFLSITNLNNAFVKGGSGPFPLANPLDQPLSGLPNNYSAPYIAELDSAGRNLLFSTTLNGTASTDYTLATGIALDASDSVYITGLTNAPDFPIVGSSVVDGAFNNGSATGSTDAFLVQITHNGASNDVALQLYPTTFAGHVGDVATFNFTIQNLTPGTGPGASNVVLETDLPLTAISLPGAECSVGTPSRCYLGTLAPGAAVSGSVTTSYASTGSFSNVFTVRTDDDDPAPSNNTVVVTANIQAAVAPDLQVTAQADTNIVALAGIDNFTVTITNNGLGAATNINLHSTLSVYSGGPFFQNVGSQWFQLMPSGTAPGARDSMSAVYDPTTHSMIMFGGFVDSLGTESNDVWVLSNANGQGLQAWTQLSPTGTAPEPRFGNTAVYDAASNRMIIFGGYSDLTTQEYNDVWVLTHANGQGGTPQWIQLSPSGSLPGPRNAAVVAYDPTTHTMTMFGGYDGSPGCGTAADAWILTNADGTTGTPNWTELNPVGTPPLGIAYGSGVYDPVTNRMIIFGGMAGNSDSCSNSNSLTILTNANGQGGTPSWISPTPDSSSVPSARQGQVAVYDPTNNIMIMTGGAADETWQLTNANAVSGNPAWSQIQPVVDAGQFSSSAATYDPVTHAMTVFGGANNNNGDTDNVWVLKGASSSCTFNSYVADASCQLGTLAPGQTTTLVLQTQFDSTAEPVTFTTTATEDQTDANPPDNTASATVNVVNPDLGVVLSAPSMQPQSSGQTYITYNFTVTNYGPGTSGGSTIMASLDANETFDSSAACYNDGGVFCSIGPLNPGDTQSGSFTVYVSSTGTYSTSVAFFNYSGDANSSNDSSTAVTTITPGADLHLSLSLPTESNFGTVGAPFLLKAQVYNGGPSDVSNATVTLTLPPQVSVGFGAPCSGTAGTVTCTVGKIVFDDSPYINIPLVANYPGVYTILATAQDNGGTQNPTPSDASYSVTVTTIPQLSSTSESFVVSLADQGQVAAYNFGSQSPTTSKSGATPGTSAIDPSGRYMYVNSGGFSAYTSVVDLTVQDEVSRIRGIHGRPMLLTPDGTRLITRVASNNTDALAIVNTSTQQIIKTVSLDGMFGDATGVADISFDSAVIANNKVYMQVSTNVPSYGIAVIDLTSFSVKAVSGTDVGAPYLSLSPHSIAAKSDGTLVYALRSTPPEMLVINTSTDSVTTTVPFTGAALLGSIVATRNPTDPSGQFAYVSGRTANGAFISQVDLSAYTMSGTPASPSFLPSDMVISSDGTKLAAFHLGASNGGNNVGYYILPLYADDGSEFTINGYLGGVSSGFLFTSNNDRQSNSTSGLAYITDVQPNPIDNSTANTLSILGGNFTTDAKVRIGHLDPVPATFVSTGRLDVTVPALIPEQDAKVIVTLPNNQEILTGRNVSTIWTQPFSNSLQTLGITSQFTLPNPLAILRYGDSTLDLVDTSKNGKNIGTLPLPTSLTFSPDGQTAYISAGAQLTGVQAISLATGTSTNIPLSNDFTGYQDALATGTDPQDGKPVLYFNSGDGQGNNQLFIVNADSTDVQFFNSIKRTVNAGDGTYSQGSGALAASPSGRYVYSFADVYNQSNSFVRTDLIAYDVKNGTAAVVHDVLNTWGAEQIIPNHLRVSPDGNFLIMPGQDGSVKAVNITADPSLATPPTTIIPFSDGTHSFKTFQVVGNRLFAFDANTNTLTAFNFLPGTSNFSKLGSVSLPGPGTFYESPLLVDPTGSTAYVALKDQDAIAILDANKVAASDPTALLDEGGSERGIEALAIQPNVNRSVNVSVAFTLPSYTVVAGTQTELPGSVHNNGTFDAHNVVVTLAPPSGFSFDSGSVDYNGLIPCTPGTTAGSLVCTIPTLKAGDSASFHAAFNVPDPAQPPSTFQIAVTTAETNTSSSASSSTSVTTILPPPAPPVTLALSSDFGTTGQLVAGQPATYTFQITNTGPNPATSLSFTVTAPGVAKIASATPSTMSLSCATDVTPPLVLQCNAPSLAVNATYVVTITGNLPYSQTTKLAASVVASNDPNTHAVNSTFNLYSAGGAPDTFLVTDPYYGFVRGATPSNVSPIKWITYAGISPVAALALPGGRVAFVASQNANYISVIDLGTQQEIYRIQSELVRTVALSSDSSQLLVVRRDDPTKLDVFDTSSFSLVKTITLTGLSSAPENMFVTNGKAFLLTKNAGPIYAVDLSTGLTSALSNAPTYGNSKSTRFGLAADGSTLVAVGGGDATNPATVFLINPFNNTVAQSTVLPTNTPHLTVAVTPKTGTSTYAYITTDNTLQVMDISTADPNYGTFVQGAGATLSLTPTSAAITSDGVTLGYTDSTPHASPNIISVDTSSALQGSANIHQFTYGSLVGIITDSQADFLPSSNAPQISYVSQYAVVNNTSNTIQINGSNFSSDAVVKIGSANPIVPSSISATQLTVTLPPFTPSGYPNVTVINQNLQDPLLANHNIPSEPSSLYVYDGPAFDQNYDAFVLNYGNSSMLASGSHPSALQGSSSNLINVAAPSSVVVTSNDQWFVGSSTVPVGDVTQGVSDPYFGVNTQDVPLSGNIGFGDTLALVSDPTSGRDVVLVPSTTTSDNINYFWQLNVVDADPYSPTYDQVLRWIPAGVSNATTTPAAFAATPDGKFAYQQVVLNNTTSDLVIYNLSNNTATIQTGIGIDPLVRGMQVSPDGKYLAVANPTSYNIQVFSIANKTSPSLVGTIALTKPNGVTLTNCCNIRIANNFLYAYDPGTMQLQAFSFQPPNFGAVGTLQLTGTPDYFFQGGLAVTPDGANLYVAELNDDVVDVIDTTQFASGDINQALVTRLSSQGIGPVSVALNGTPSSQNFADLSVSVSHSPDPATLGGTLTYTIATTNLGPDQSGNAVITDTLPSGFTLSSYTFDTGDVFCSGTNVVTCSLGTLNANQTSNVNLTVSTAGPSGVGQYTNTVTVGQTGQTVPDPMTANNTASDIANLADPDLAISATADKQNPAISGTVNFTVNVVNNGQVPATGTTISGSLTAGNITAATGCSTTATTFSCPIGQVGPNGSAGVTITATMPGTAGSVTFNATVSENETDGNSNDNTLNPPITIAVGGGADLVLAPAGAPVNVNGVPTYTVVVTNNGPDPAQNVTVQDTLSGFGFVSAVSSAGACSFRAGSVYCPVGNLASGSSATVNVSVTAPSSGWASNEFHASSDTFDPIPTNNLVNMGPFGGSIGNTAAGPNVLVDALDSSSGMAANFLFANIIKPGLTKVTSTAGAQAPSGYRFGTPALIYDLSTSASYSGSIRVALRLNGITFHHPNAIHLFHFENGTWVDRTMALDAAHGMITGMTSSLSPFVIVEPLNSVPVANAGTDQTIPGASANGTSVALNGAASTDADGDALTYTWTGPFPEGNGSVTGANPKVTLPLGISKLSLVVNDGEASSAPAAVNVTVSDFLIAAPATAITLARGQSTSFNVVLTPKFGAFNDAVTVACGNVPAGLTCAVKDNSVTPGTQGASVTVTLTASASAALHNNSGPLFAFWMGGLPVFGFLLTGKFKRDRRSMFILLAIVLLLVIGMVACGSAGSNSVTQPSPQSSSTTTSITLTGTSGDLQHSSTATVTLQ